MSKSRNIAIITLSVLAVGLSVWVGYLLINNQKDDKNNSVTDFASCAAAGNPVMESYPRQCAANGVTYTEVIDNVTKTYVSDKGVVIKINNWSDNKKIASPLTITGEVPGSWSFEASFPVVLVDWDGLIIAEKPATLQGDWMTDEYVPFSVTVEFTNASSNKNGAIILRKDNPSGLPENDDAVEIPITYS